MADFNRNRSGGRNGRPFGGGRSDGGRSSFGGGRDGGRPSYGRSDDRGGRGGYDKPQMYPAVCDDCGAPCELPFRPSGDKPVFCRDCFNKSGNGKSAPRGNDSFRNERADSFREPRKEYRSESKQEATAPGITKEQFEMLNAKLDKILKFITPVITVSKEMQVDAAAKEEKKSKKEADVKEEPKVKKDKKAAKKAKKD